MNHRLLLASILAGGITGLRAQTNPAAPSYTWTITPALASQYMFRGARLGGPSLQPTVELAAGSLAVGVWASFPLKDKVVGQSDPEFDFYASYTVEAIKDVMTWQPGVTCYFYPGAEKKNGFYQSTLEPNLALNYTVSGVKFTPKIGAKPFPCQRRLVTNSAAKTTGFHSDQPHDQQRRVSLPDWNTLSVEGGEF